jgi:DNA-directed RNA polymerase specialized sigma24 family protein
MANGIQAARIANHAAYLPTEAIRPDEAYEAFERYRDRMYSLGFWMTDNELEAEQLLRRVFVRVFSQTDQPTAEMMDRALVTELRSLMPIGVLTLESGTVREVVSVRRNTLRVHLERAIVQLPPTERLAFCMHDGEGYSHQRVAVTIGISVDDSRIAVHEARLRIRQLVSTMN